ncbi:MAG: lysophospholipid acyltransferase family protein [Alistipes sp.]
MLSILFYIYASLLCTVFMIFSAVVLVLSWPFDKSRRLVHGLSQIMVHLFFGLPPFWHHRVIGLEHVDRTKSYVMVLNHRAMTDIPALYYVPLNFRWVSKREVFRLPFFGQFLRLHGDICIDRGHGSEAMEQLLRDGGLWISRGASVAVFPEGTRSKDGELHRFKIGAFELAKEAGVPILPIVLDGTTTLVKPNKAFNWHNMVTVRVLPAISAEQVATMDVKALAAEAHQRMATELEKMKQA